MQQTPFLSVPRRIRLIKTVLVLISVLFVARLFYLQVIRYDYYQTAARDSQLKRYEIPAERGKILALDGNERVPLVLNEIRYNIVADPKIITNKNETATKLAELLGGNKDTIRGLLSKETRYEIIAKKQTKDIKEKLEALMAAGEVQATFAEKTVQRVYPQGALAAQLLGFVNDDAQGNYGIEQALNRKLTGTPGKVKALTDQNGVPLYASGENILEDPIDGETITLSIDVALQRQVETLLEAGLKQAKSESGSVIVMDPDTGQVKAMANYPSYEPAKYATVENAEVFNNAAVSSSLEPGSIMKTLTLAAALNAGVVTPDTTYFDPGYVRIGDATVTNVEESGGSGTRTMRDILRMSLNTGATYLLKQMGGGEINEQARTTWNTYMTEHYRLGRTTGIEQGFEETGYVPDPLDGYGLNIQYANASFGQGMTATPLQMLAAVSSIVNGGTYYQPTLVAGTQGADGVFKEHRPVIVKNEVISKDASTAIRGIMQHVVNSNLPIAVRSGYTVGGKTGTAQIANPQGGYYSDRFNGTYVGFVGGDMPQYTIIVRANDPKVPGYAGTKAAAPIFANVVTTLIDNFGVSAMSGN